MDIQKQLIEEFNLPKYIKNKSFAEASQAIEKKFNDRKDPAAKQTMQELLERLAEAQEYVKMQEEAAQQSQQSDIPEGMEEFTAQPNESNQMFLGGNVDSNQIEETDSIKPGMGDLNTALDFSNNMFGNQETQSTEQKNVGVESLGSAAKGALAGSKFGPIGTVAGGTLGLASGIIGGNKRNKQAAQNLTNEDMSIGLQDRNLFKSGGYTNKYYKGGPVDPPVTHTGNVVTGNLNPSPAPERTKFLQEFNEHLRKNNKGTYNGPFIDGNSSTNTGNNFTNSSNDSNNNNQESSNNNQPKRKPQNSVDNLQKNNTPIFSNQDVKGFDIPDLNKALSTSENSFNQSNPNKSNSNEPLNWLKRNSTEIARTAPIINNLLTSKNLKKAQPIRRDQLGMRYNSQQLDEESLFNKINQNNVNKALSETSGGDLGGLRSSILAANLNKDKAASDASMQVQQQNLQDNVRGQEFNRGVDSVNMQQTNQDKVDARRDDAAYETTKQNLRNATAENIASLAREIGDKETVKRMFGYKFDGTYFYDDKGNKIPEEEVVKNVKKNNKTKNNESLFKDGGTGKTLDASLNTGTIV